MGKGDMVGVVEQAERVGVEDWAGGIDMEACESRSGEEDEEDSA